MSDSQGLFNLQCALSIRSQRIIQIKTMRCIRSAARAWRQSSTFCANLTGLIQPEQTSLSVVCKRCISRPTSWKGLSSYPGRALSLPFGFTFSSFTALSRLGTAPSLQSQACRSASSIIQFPLAQTGEGIKECELTEWFVEVSLFQISLITPRQHSLAVLRSVLCAERESSRGVSEDMRSTK